MVIAEQKKKKDHIQSDKRGMTPEGFYGIQSSRTQADQRLARRGGEKSAGTYLRTNLGIWYRHATACRTRMLYAALACSRFTVNTTTSTARKSTYDCGRIAMLKQL